MLITWAKSWKSIYIWFVGQVCTSLLNDNWFLYLHKLGNSKVFSKTYWHWLLPGSLLLCSYTRYVMFFYTEVISVITFLFSLARKLDAALPLRYKYQPVVAFSSYNRHFGSLPLPMTWKVADITFLKLYLIDGLMCYYLSSAFRVLISHKCLWHNTSYHSDISTSQNLFIHKNSFYQWPTIFIKRF